MVLPLELRLQTKLGHELERGAEAAKTILAQVGQIR